MRTKKGADIRPRTKNPQDVRDTEKNPRPIQRRLKKRRKWAVKQRSHHVLKRKLPKVNPQNDIVYRKPPVDQADRSRRRAAQRRLAKGRNKNWKALGYAEKDRRIRFGSKAACRNSRDVRDLAHINARIAHKREMSAVKTWRLTSDQISQLKRCVGFSWARELFASNKAVRVETAYQLSLLMARLWRHRRKHFYWITIVHSGWHDGHHNTGIRLSDIARRTQTVMKRAGVSWFGMIELDLFNNWPYPGRGLRITPHVHLLAWGNRPKTPREIRSRLNCKGLRSMNGANVVVVKSVRTAKRLAHLCYYMTKPNYLVKSLGQQRRDLLKRPIYSVEKNVRPGHTLRIAEILSYMKIGELMMAQGEGRRIKEKLISEIVSRAVVAPHHCLKVSGVRKMWKSMMPVSRRRKAHVMIDRNGIL